MKKEEKYLKQIRLFRLNQQVKKSTFEMALYFDYFGIDKSIIQNVYNTTLDNEEFTLSEKKQMFNDVKEMLDKIYNIKI